MDIFWFDMLKERSLKTAFVENGCVSERGIFHFLIQSEDLQAYELDERSTHLETVYVDIVDGKVLFIKDGQIVAVNDLGKFCTCRVAGNPDYMYVRDSARPLHRTPLGTVYVDYNSPSHWLEIVNQEGQTLNGQGGTVVDNTMTGLGRTLHMITQRNDGALVVSAALAMLIVGWSYLFINSMMVLPVIIFATGLGMMYHLLTRLRSAVLSGLYVGLFVSLGGSAAMLFVLLMLPDVFNQPNFWVNFIFLTSIPALVCLSGFLIAQSAVSKG